MKRKTGYFERVGDTLFSVYFDSDFGEYSVRVKTDNAGFDADRAYFTSDKDDANSTCKAMAREERENHVTSNNEELAVVVNKCQTLQKLWDHNRLMQQTLLDVGKHILAAKFIGPDAMKKIQNKCLTNAKNISDHDAVCALLQRAGVNL